MNDPIKVLKIVERLLLPFPRANGAAWANDVLRCYIESVEEFTIWDIESGAESLKKGQLWLATDFAASADLRAQQTDNSSVDNHCVICIFYVRYNRRTVYFIDEDGKAASHVIYDTDAWHFFGESQSKGKMNDHVFHNACLEKVVEHYKERYSNVLGRQLRRVYLWTDNSGSQYKCQQNF